MTTDPLTVNEPPEDPGELKASLIGDPTLAEVDKFVSSLMALLKAVGDAKGRPEVPWITKSLKSSCGVCDAKPISWVMVKRGRKMVRVARCEGHRPADSHYLELIER